jgi:hypothetical protein
MQAKPATLPPRTYKEHDALLEENAKFKPDLTSKGIEALVKWQRKPQQRRQLVDPP